MSELQNKLENLNLSKKAQSLLEWVAEGEHDDPRGFYCEFQHEGYKPWKAEHVAELVENGLVVLHEESDSVPETVSQCEGEELDGVAFLTLA